MNSCEDISCNVIVLNFDISISDSLSRNDLLVAHGGAFRVVVNSSVFGAAFKRSLVDLGVMRIWIWANSSTLGGERVSLAVQNVHGTSSAKEIVIDITGSPGNVENGNCGESF